VLPYGSLVELKQDTRQRFHNCVHSTIFNKSLSIMRVRHGWAAAGGGTHMHNESQGFTSQRTFATDTSGSIAIAFSLTFALLLLCAGGAVDFMRWQNARTTTSAAIDAAVLAGGRSLILKPQDSAAAMDAANAVYGANVSQRHPVQSDSIRFVVDSAQGTISAMGTATIKTTLLSAVGITELTLISPSGADHASAQVSPGGPGGSNLEIALLLDVTGSMCDDGIGPCLNGTKIDGLKSAAAELIDIVVRPTSSGYVSRVALVPFATKVRVGPDGGGAGLMKSLTNLDGTWSGVFHDCTDSSGGGGSETEGDWTCLAYSDIPVADWKVMPCVTERYQNDVFDVSDAAPGPGNWLNGHDGSRRMAGNDSSDVALAFGQGTGVAGDPADHWNFREDGDCGDIAEGNDVQPLTTNKAALLSRVNDLQGYGGTAGALGTSWSWYMLAPDWSSVWTGGSAPGAYADLTTIQENGAPLLRKVAVLMTDGGYNAFRAGKEQDQQMVSDYAKDVCGAMKLKGIEIYTVGFALNSLTPAEATIARETLQACGSDVSHFYETLDVPQLKTAFRSIGSKMSGLRLTQ
jgi:Flp pilus assembly protein TadG